MVRWGLDLLDLIVLILGWAARAARAARARDGCRSLAPPASRSLWRHAMPKNNLKEHLGILKSGEFRPKPLDLPPFDFQNASSVRTSNFANLGSGVNPANNFASRFNSVPSATAAPSAPSAARAPSTPAPPIIDLLSSSSPPALEKPDSSDWDDDLDLPELPAHTIEILDSEADFDLDTIPEPQRLADSPPVSGPASGPTSGPASGAPVASSGPLGSPLGSPRGSSGSSGSPLGSPLGSNIVDLTAEPQQSRFSILQAEKIGLLEKKVRMLMEKLDKAAINYSVGDIDDRIRRVDGQISALGDPGLGDPEYTKPDLPDDLIISSPHKRATLLSSPALSPLETSHYFDSARGLPQATPATQSSPSQPASQVASQIAAASQHARNPWTEEMFHVLTSKFGLLRFRSQQKDIIDWTLAGKDAIVLMPTGGGKSLCFQLPALCKSGATHGTTVVISPLISLMQDQVYHLKNRDIPAQMINSSLSQGDREAAFQELVQGSLKLVYLSPEMLSISGRMRNELKKLHDSGNLARIVIDEAHCVSSWGHDFREDYLKLTGLKDEYPRTPVLALTGTANGAVLSDIKRCVRSNHNLFKQSFNRPNLYYEVRPKTESTVVSEIARIYHQCQGKTGIVFCHSQNSCEKTAKMLQNQRISAGYYHAGLPKEQRQQLQEGWQENKIKVMCATIAFGMGVDKPDVRFVVHLTLPRSIEGFYQESGRAGRDGLESRCIMFYNRGDYAKLSRLIYSDRNVSSQQKESNGENLKRVMQYCENMTDCRRKQILQYFDENVSSKICRQKCDNCLRKRTSRTIEKDMTREARIVVQLLETLGNDRVTSLLVVDILRGLKHKRITDKGYESRPHHGKLKDLDRTTVERLIYRLQDKNILQEYTAFNQGRTSMPSTYVRLGPSHRNVLNGARVVLDFIEESSIGSAGSAGSARSVPLPSVSTRPAAKRSKPQKQSAPKRKRFESSTQKSRQAAGNIRAMPL